MLKFTFAMILLTQLNAAQAFEEKSDADSSSGLLEVLQRNGVETKGLVLIEDQGNEEEVGVSEKFSGICCKRWISGVGNVDNCIPYVSEASNDAFRNSCYKWGGDAYQYVNADEKAMRAKYGVDINFK